MPLRSSRFPLAIICTAKTELHAGVSSWRRIDDNAIPARGKICGAYVNSALASDDARRCGFDEAIFLNEAGHVAEGATVQHLSWCAKAS